MKYAQVNGILSRAAAVIALSVGASAQLVNREAGALASRPIRTVSLENDIRERELTLAFKMRPRAGTDPLAVIPLPEEMIRTLELSNGTPGGGAVIHLETRSLELRSGAGSRVQIVGLFDEDGTFSYELPAGADVHGLFATGEDGQQVAHILGHELLKKSAGGAAVADSEQPEMDVPTFQAEPKATDVFRGRDAILIGNFEFVKKSAGGAAVPASERPEMDVPTLPPEPHATGVFQGRDVLHIGNRELVKKSAGGAAVPASERPEMEVLDLEEESEKTYAKWWTIWTDLQLGKGHTAQAR